MNCFLPGAGVVRPWRSFFLSRTRHERRASEVAYLSHHAVIVIIIIDQQEDSSASTSQLTYHKSKIATPPTEHSEDWAACSRVASTLMSALVILCEEQEVIATMRALRAETEEAAKATPFSSSFYLNHFLAKITIILIRT